MTLKTKITKGTRYEYLEVKKGFRNTVNIHLDTIPNLYKWLTEGKSVVYEDQWLRAGKSHDKLVLEGSEAAAGGKIALSQSEAVELLKALESQIMPRTRVEEPVESKKPVEPMVEPVARSAKSSGVPLFKLLGAKVEWSPYVTCPHCSVKVSLDSRLKDAGSVNGLGMMCPKCSQIVVLVSE